MSFGIEDLISSVFKRVVSHTHFKDRNVTSEAWKEVCIELKTNEEVLVRKKWKTLKDYYRSEVNKLEKATSGSSGSPKKVSTWPYFQQLEFIRKTLGNKRNCSLQPSEILTDTSVANDNSISGDEADQDQDSENQQDVANDVSPANNEITVSEKSCETGQGKRLKPSKRNHGNEFKELFLENERKKVALLERASEDDDDMMFFQSLLPDIKPLPRTGKLRLRMDIQKLVYDAVVRHTTPYAPPPPPCNWDIIYTSSSTVSSPTATASFHEDCNTYSSLTTSVNDIQNNGQ